MKKVIALATILVLIFTTFAFANNQEVDESYIIKIDEDIIDYDIVPQRIDEKLMIPLRFTLEEMGFDIQWNSEEKSVDIQKNAIYTKVFIGENSYYKNKMAPMSLSTAPIVTSGRTLVPIEFFAEILNLAFEVKENQIIFTSDEEEYLAKHEGYITKIQEVDFGTRYHLSSEEGEEVFLIVTSNENTIYQRNVEEGDFIHVVSPPIMLMSYPGQTGATVIY